MNATIQSVLRDGIRLLDEAQIPVASRDARKLMAAALNLPAERLILVEHDAITSEAQARFAGMVDARARNQPVAQIIGHRMFWGRRFDVTRDVLDPRPETETLVSLALESPAPRLLLDLGTGSGALVVTLLAEWPDARGFATDLSPAALAVARRNAERHGVDARVKFLRADWLAGISDGFDLVVCNPPYLAGNEIDALDADVRDWEPRVALTPGPEGIESYARIAADLASVLVPGGHALFEIGPGQGTCVCEIFAAAGFEDVTVHPDLDGRDRVVSLRAPGSP